MCLQNDPSYSGGSSHDTGRRKRTHLRQTFLSLLLKCWCRGSGPSTTQLHAHVMQVRA